MGVRRVSRKVKVVQKRELNYLWEVIEIEEVKQDTSGPEHEIVILFRDLLLDLIVC